MRKENPLPTSNTLQASVSWLIYILKIEHWKYKSKLLFHEIGSHISVTEHSDHVIKSES